MEIPVWFLVFALLVPRISLFVLWIHGWTFVVPQPISGATWLFLPRVLVVLLLFTAQGFSPWFWLHVGATLLLYVVSILKPYINEAQDRTTTRRKSIEYQEAAV